MDTLFETLSAAQSYQLDRRRAEQKARTALRSLGEVMKLYYWSTSAMGALAALLTGTLVYLN